jgi:radical SAM/Cys-rich protein
MKIHSFIVSILLLSSCTDAFVNPKVTSHVLRGKESNHSLRSSGLPDYGSTSVDIDQHKLEDSNKWKRPDLFGKSIIEQTKREMESDIDFQETSQKLKEIGLKGMSKEERTKRRRALDDLGIPTFNEFLAQNIPNDAHEKEIILKRKDTEVLQLNVGLYCNQACGHCHVESSPLRTEAMTEEVAAQCLNLLKNSKSVHTLDITGGAPEMNPTFRYIVSMARALRPDIDIIDRCNLTVLHEPGQEDLIPFLVKNKVHVIASLPCYSAENVDKQRGNGVFDRSISALLALNEAGYGQEGTGLLLDLVYNPLGAFLPPPQASLESKYKEVLNENFGIVFNNLFTMTNMPVKRFTDFLYRRGELKDYMDLLVRNFNPNTVQSIMCTNTISVGFDGKIYDCDFNQQLGYALGSSEAYDGGKTVFDVSSLSELSCDSIKNDNHCFGCVAGSGSS